MADHVRVREATIEDVDAIARVHVETWKGAYRGQIPDDYLASLTVDARADAWREWWSRGQIGDQEIFVAEADGVLVGFVNVGPSRDQGAGGETGEVRAIYVLPEYWDRHVGSALMRRGIDAMRPHYREAVLWTLATNDRGKRFYEWGGWELDGAERSDERGGARQVEVRFRIGL